MPKALVRLAFAVTLAVASCGVSTTSFAQDQSAVCPAKYWLMGTLCLNHDTGDVVLASTTTTGHVVSAGCRPGYWRQDALCFSSLTGDVELVDEQR
jgi:hypothetical protein